VSTVAQKPRNLFRAQRPSYEGVSKSSRTGRLERELQMVQLSATRCSCIAILWVILVSFAATTLCIASQRVFIVVFVVVYFVIDSVRKVLDTSSYISFVQRAMCRCVYNTSKYATVSCKLTMIITPYAIHFPTTITATNGSYLQMLYRTLHWVMLVLYKPHNLHGYRHWCSKMGRRWTRFLWHIVHTKFHENRSDWSVPLSWGRTDE
jgi:hypothetical protein